MGTDFLSAEASLMEFALMFDDLVAEVAYFLSFTAVSHFLSLDFSKNFTPYDMTVTRRISYIN